LGGQREDPLATGAQPVDLLGCAQLALHGFLPAPQDLGCALDRGGHVPASCGVRVVGSVRSLAEEAFGAYTKGVAAWVDKASKSAPAGSDVAVNAFKSTMAATTAAFDQFQKASKQVVSMADANVRAAAATATKSVKGKRAA
jgi:hypothetical protein